jgi:transcriptional regulator with XRE-family HTH domain
MNPTATLLKTALARYSQADLAREANIDPSTIASAKIRKHTPPELAGFLAEKLNLDVDKWIAVAGLEQGRSSPIKQRLLTRLQHEVLSALKS